MLNKEFQELKGLFARNSKDPENIIERMRENLKKRNNGESEYVFGYTYKGEVINIETCSNVPEDLFRIDGDMCPMGK